MALPVLGDVEKEYLVQLLRRLCGVYFASVLGSCVMDNHLHLHLLVRMHTRERAFWIICLPRMDSIA